MKFKELLCRLLLLCFSACLGFSVEPSSSSKAGPLLSPVFSDHMVLQRGKANRLWGWTAPGSVVRVAIAGIEASATAAADGRWQVEFMPPPVGGPYVLQVTGPESLELKDLLVGDVWLCGGQSNMAMGVGASKDGAEEIRQANLPQLRLFQVPQHASYAPTLVATGSWRVCTPAELGGGGWGGFSAVAFFFGRRLQQELNVPIGLIQDAVGGTPAESWMDPRTLASMPWFQEAMSEVARLRDSNAPEYGNYISHWYDEFEPGQRGAGWFASDLDETGWKTVALPGGFAELGVPATPSVCWFRRDIELPDPLPAGEARIQLGVVEKMDTTYVNGRWVGASSWVENPRSYPLAKELLHPGKNQVTLRVFKLKPDGGFQSPGDNLKIVLGDGRVVPLAGDWKGKLAVDARPPHRLPLGYENYPTMPSVLFEGMIRPLAPLALTGALWYQGEANASRAHQYKTLLPAMIADWRRLFGQGDLPFYISGLPAFMPRKSEPGDDEWAELREAQAFTASTVSNTALSVNIDTGEAGDIHPKEKKPVGERLALCALAGHYGRKLVSSGPRYVSIEKVPGSLRVKMSHADGGLLVHGSALEGFAIAGADRRWHWATAKIEGDCVLVSSPEVPSPVAVRYAWQSNPPATLFNGAGFPAAPFRSDDWPGITEKNAP